ncbi:MAG: histidine phosphatase family protein [Desulfobulbaceae bacterium]|nr:histidine phosphatase family protein [Desulfobulbaceae bacterium]
MTEIYLLRHGDTGAGPVLAGSTDLPLAPHAFGELAAASHLLAAVHFDHIWRSPRLRCQQTLAAVLPGAEAEIIDDLREVDFGHWEMKKFSEISEEYREDVARLAAWDQDFAFPGGESITSFLARVAAVRAQVAALTKARGDQKILMVTHSGVIRQLLCGWLGIPSRHYLLFAVKPGKITTLSIHEDGGVLTGFNLG